MENKEIRVRFAPSPTGYLHIGSARTAFFNWLFAKKMNGKFILRIEDTDIGRHKENTINTILNSLKWLGISWDEGTDIGGNYGPYRQSQRLEIYKEYAQKLINEGSAYRCFCSLEQLREKRNQSIKTCKFYSYDRECLKLTGKEISDNINSGKKFSVRILVPKEKIITFNDNVYGKIQVNSINIEDFIILRSNGMPTYNFSAAIDDYLMNITHIIRGEDHLSNTPKQLLIYDALNFMYPDFTHLPMILASDGSKLSKRHGSISIESYKKEGFLPEAVLNYIALLGWAYDEKTTIFSINEMIEKFDLKSINKKAARFDYEKLLYVNGFYIRELEESRLAKLIMGRLTGTNRFTRENLDFFKSKLPKIIPITKQRVRTISDYEKIALIFSGKISYSKNYGNKYFLQKEIDAKAIIRQTIKYLEEPSVHSFDAQNIEKALKKVAADFDTAFKNIAEVIRIAVWGEPAGPPLFETIEILEKNNTLLRLKNYIDFLG
ncbi:MAG: glutamate--tRNA ligase [Actinobacteria bacterium]|nr:glutamate--tRNA ligase [Actinomycetota bacterium]